MASLRDKLHDKTVDAVFIAKIMSVLPCPTCKKVSDAICCPEHIVDHVEFMFGLEELEVAMLLTKWEDSRRG